METKTYLLNILVQTSIGGKPDLQLLEITASPAVMHALYSALPFDPSANAVVRDELRVLGPDGCFMPVAYSERNRTAA